VFDLDSLDDADGGGARRITTRARLEALSRSDVFLVPSKEVGSALQRVLGREIRALVTGEHSGAETVDAPISEALATVTRDRTESGQERPPTARRSRPRLAVFTPLPPQRTGVGDYSAATFSAVADHADVVIYTDPTGRVPDGRVEIRPYAIDPYLDGTFDAVVSVLGNSLFHIPALEYFHEFGGPCIAHDPWMAGVYSFRHGPQALAQLLSRHAGRPVLRNEIPAMLEDPDRLPATAYDEIAPRARPLLVHSEKIAGHILSETGVRSVVLPYVPHRLPRASTLDEAIVANARESLGWRATEFHVVTFGIVHSRAKGLEVLLEALAALRANGSNAYLHFVGPVPASELRDLMGRAETLGISQRLDLTGWVSGETFERYLLAADAAVQLRTYARAPLSGALLDCIAFGIPTVSTRSLAQDMGAPGYVGGVSDDLGAQALTQALEILSRTPRVHSIGAVEPERRAWLSERTTDVYARRLLDALGLGSA
jgi:glycosyltransferase involved in cell wall biosynthesis